MNAKRVLALSLASAFAVTTFGCSKSETASTTKPEADDKTTADAGESKDESQQAAPSEHTDITMATWYDMYYTSDNEGIDDQPGITKRDIAEMQWNSLKKLEKDYNVSFHAENMTWDGVINSINSSILAGKPDAQVYLTDLQFGVPAVLKGMAMAASEYGATERLEEKKVMKGLTIGTQEETYLFSPYDISSNAVYVLGFNMDMIKKHNLENPQDLYDRQEWTWDKFMEYMKVLTEDTNKDGAIDVYGYGGWWTTLLSYLLMSNDADIAATDTEHLSDPKTLEALEFIQRMYIDEAVAKPWDSEDWDINNFSYTKQQQAFWISANWIAQEGGDADPEKVSFEVGFVPFPKGPSAASFDYNTKATAGNWYIIPKGTENASLVFDVMYDWTNWYDYDTEYRDDNEWAMNVTYSPKAEDPERNFNILLKCAEREAFDPWQSLTGPDGSGIIAGWQIMTGEKTAAQYVEENKQLVQDALNNMFK